METGRRSTDKEEKSLSEKVAVLDKDVQNLRVEFDYYRKQSLSSDKTLTESISILDKKINTHIQTEEVRHKDLYSNINTIKDSINILRMELKEPLEVYKTAKYSIVATKWLRNTIMFLLPMITGIVGTYYFLVDYLHK